MPDVDFSGVWFNQHHSQMTLKIEPDGRLSGEYQTKVGAPKPNEKFLLVGFAAGDQISFTVNFGAYGSLTAWVGQHYVDPSTKDATIYTFWQLTKNVEDQDEKDKLWASVLTGSDRFSRTLPKEQPALMRLRPSHPVRVK